MLETPDAVHPLLEKTTVLSIAHALRLSQTGVGVNIYESWATLPLIARPSSAISSSPTRRGSSGRSASGTPPRARGDHGRRHQRPDRLLHRTGTSLVVADYMTDFTFMRTRLAAEAAPWSSAGASTPEDRAGRRAGLAALIQALARKARGLDAYVWGCGCVPLTTPRENVVRFKELCLAADPDARAFPSDRRALGSDPQGRRGSTAGAAGRLHRGQPLDPRLPRHIDHRLRFRPERVVRGEQGGAAEVPVRGFLPGFWIEIGMAAEPSGSAAG